MVNPARANQSPASGKQGLGATEKARTTFKLRLDLFIASPAETLAQCGRSFNEVQLRVTVWLSPSSFSPCCWASLRSAQHTNPSNVARLNTANLRNGIEDMQSVWLPRLTHNSTASFSTRSRMCGLSSCSGTRSTLRWSKFMSCCVNGRRCANKS